MSEGECVPVYRLVVSGPVPAHPGTSWHILPDAGRSLCQYYFRVNKVKWMRLINTWWEAWVSEKKGCAQPPATCKNARLHRVIFSQEKLIK